MEDSFLMGGTGKEYNEKRLVGGKTMKHFDNRLCELQKQVFKQQHIKPKDSFRRCWRGRK